MQSYLASTWKKDSVLIPKPTWFISLTYREAINKKDSSWGPIDLHCNSVTAPAQWARLVAQIKPLPSISLPACLSQGEKKKTFFFQILGHGSVDLPLLGSLYGFISINFFLLRTNFQRYESSTTTCMKAMLHNHTWQAAGQPATPRIKQS